MPARTRRLLLVAAAAVALVGTAAPASATPRSAEAWTAEREAPYGQGARWYQVVRCGEDARCSAAGTVDPQSGGARAEVAYDRQTGGVPEEAEHVQGTALQSLTVPVPRGATRATATFTWAVQSASVRASSQAGDVLAFASLHADSAGCRKCETSPGNADVAAVSSSDGLDSSKSVDAATFTLSTTVTGALPRELTLTSDATAVINSRQGNGLCPAGLCLGSERSAAASIDATLSGVRVVFE